MYKCGCICGYVCGSNAHVHAFIYVHVYACVCECVTILTTTVCQDVLLLGPYTGTKMVAVLVFSDSSSNANRAQMRRNAHVNIET